ncbi:hypothetical protein HZH66_008259 [Vespula vulgaris]|uniref:Uncharacterized protein n=1 Tax=Vespula vulgaris TaxID=7454 RepID=A0A834N373_VESVU|nr:hypothetical protein HZH66_008259 [Vespula vulgaris]
METSSSEYAFNRRGNEFKRYDTIGHHGTDEFAPFIKGDGFGNSNLNVANSIYGFNYPTAYKIRNIGKGTRGMESSLRRLGGQDSSLGNIEGFDYDGSDGFHIKGSLTRSQYYGLPRHAENYKLSRNKLGLGDTNIRLHSNLGTDNLRKSIGIQNVPYGNILENDLLTDDIVIPYKLNLDDGFKNGIIDDKYNFAIGDISRYQDEEKTEAVEKLGNTYEVTEDFDKDEKEAIGKSHLFGYQEDFAETKKDEEEEDLKYGKNESAAKELSSESHGKNESHKKGHKTSGFHNVYHKDEYKKDTSFYDNEHVDEHEESYGSENSEHEEAEGEQKNIKKLDAGYQENEHAQKEIFLNGHQYGTAQGHDREASGKEHYVKNAAFLKKDEQSARKVKGDSLYLKKHY